MKAVVAAFNQEKALVGAFSVIVQLHRWIDLRHYLWLLQGRPVAQLRQRAQHPRQDRVRLGRGAGRGHDLVHRHRRLQGRLQRAQVPAPEVIMVRTRDCVSLSRVSEPSTTPSTRSRRGWLQGGRGTCWPPGSWPPASPSPPPASSPHTILLCCDTLIILS